MPIRPILTLRRPLRASATPRYVGESNVMAIIVWWWMMAAPAEGALLMALWCSQRCLCIPELQCHRDGVLYVRQLSWNEANESA